MIWGESYIKPKDRYLIVILKTLFSACWSQGLKHINHVDKGHWNQISIKICSIMSLICFSSINFFPSILYPINQICCSACNSLWRIGLWFYEVNAAEPFNLHRLKFYVCCSFLLFSSDKILWPILFCLNLFFFIHFRCHGDCWGQIILTFYFARLKKGFCFF